MLVSRAGVKASPNLTLVQSSLVPATDGSTATIGMLG